MPSAGRPVAPHPTGRIASPRRPAHAHINPLHVPVRAPAASTHGHGRPTDRPTPAPRFYPFVARLSLQRSHHLPPRPTFATCAPPPPPRPRRRPYSSVANEITGPSPPASSSPVEGADRARRRARVGFAGRPWGRSSGRGPPRRLSPSLPPPRPATVSLTRLLSAGSLGRISRGKPRVPILSYL